MPFHENLASLPSTVQEVVRRIVSRARPDRVILFGSRARGTARENSDFDIAVVGRHGSDREWADLVTEITYGSLTLFKVDLVEWERLGPEYRKHIQAEGKPLYG